MEALGNLNNALWSFHTRQETSRTVRTSWSIFRCLLFFDMIILMSGVALMVMALVNAGKYEELETMILGGASLGLFATVSAMCNSLACHGLRTWKRNFLLPWLAFYFLVLGFMSTFLLQTVYNKEFLLQKRHVFLFFLIFAIFYCWTHVKKQYLMMMLPRPEQVTFDDLRDMLAILPFRVRNQNNIIRDPLPGDSPPKYEELDFPPQYDEATMPPAIEEVVPTPSGTSSDEVSSTTTTTTTQSEIVNETQSTTNIEVKVDEQAEMVPTSTDSNK